ncbi:MAG: MFS transporter [Acidimicrobiales bacterium]
MSARLMADGRRPTIVALMSVIAIASYNNLSAAAALPDIGDDLGDIGLLPFVITIELLTSAVAVLAAGPIVDSLGARRVFRVASTGFIVTSLTVAAAPTMPLLLVARGVQGVFAGAIMTVAVASIGLAIPQNLRPKAFALTSAVWGVMGVAGPAIAALFVATVGWRAIFLVNVPVTVLAVVIGWDRIPDRPEGAAHQAVDRVGLGFVAVITTSALALATYSPLVIGVATAILAVSVPLYVRWSRRTPDPVVRLHHLLEDRYRTVHLTSMAVLAGGVGANSFLPLYLRTARGQSAGLAAFGVLFLTVGWSTSAYVSSRLQERWSGEWVSLLGSANRQPRCRVRRRLHPPRGAGRRRLRRLLLGGIGRRDGHLHRRRAPAIAHDLLRDGSTQRRPPVPANPRDHLRHRRRRRDHPGRRRRENRQCRSRPRPVVG